MESQMKRLKEEADIKTVVDALGIPVERKGMNYFLRCPSPEHDDTNPSAYFKDGWNNIYCNSCCRAFKALDVIMLTAGWDIKEAANYLWELEGCPDWFVASEEERMSFSLTPQEARTIGLRPSGETACCVSYGDMKRPLGLNEHYAPHVIDGYLKVKNTRVSWKDFMSEQEFAGLVIRKAAEAADTYRRYGMKRETEQAIAVLRRAAKVRQAGERLSA